VRLRFLISAIILGAVSFVIYAQKRDRDDPLPKPFQQYPALEYSNFPVPPDAGRQTEFARARMMYTSIYGRWGRGAWYWTMDYPRSDRHLLAGIRRLTRIDTRSVEEPVSLKGDEGRQIYNWPFLYAVEVGHWALTDTEINMLRDYLLHGGFLMVDDFHGTEEWAVFMASMGRVFPDRPIVDLQPDNPIFHVLYDINDRLQAPGSWNWFENHRTYEKDGYNPEFRGILDDKGRVMVAICHNMDLGDAWEWSDDPRYPEKFAGFAYRIAVNYTIYDMTH
jgi:Domain of unknown function (DUF4159)